MKSVLHRFLFLCLVGGAITTGAFFQMPEFTDTTPPDALLDYAAANFPTVSHPNITSAVHPTEIFSDEAGYQASFSVHGRELPPVSGKVDWTRMQVLHFSGTLTVEGQYLHYGFYHVRSLDGTPVENSADLTPASYLFAECTDASYGLREHSTFHVDLENGQFHVSGDSVMTKLLPNPQLYRDGWSIRHMPRYIRYPFTFDQYFDLPQIKQPV